MKKAILFLALITSVGMYAQTTPYYEVEGEMVKATYYHENGEIAQIGHFVNEQLQGEWKMYNEEGKKIAMGHYNNGVKTGKWFFWEGQNLNEVDFNENKIAHAVQWNNSEAIVLNK